VLLGGPGGLLPPGFRGELDEFAGLDDYDPFFPSIPAVWNEKKGPARTPPKNPRTKHSRRRK
jgi:hypothetical protein